MRVIGLAGWSGAGKTTLLVKLIPELNRRGLTVSTVKRAHHAFEIDRPGKDSFEHRRAGAGEVLIASSGRWALVHELRGAPEPTLADHLRRLSPADLVVVEGFKAHHHPKIEVFRSANGKPLLGRSAPNIRGVAADVKLPDLSVSVVDLDDVGAVADLALAVAEPVESVLADLDARPGPARIALREAAGAEAGGSDATGRP